MAVWSEVALTKIEHGRVDPEFYQPFYLSAYSKAGNKKLKHYGVEILHPTEVKRRYSVEGLGIVLAQNNRDNDFDWSEKRFMPNAMRHTLRKNLLQFGDVIVTRSGANYGQTSVITIETLQNELFACADLLIIKPGNLDGCLLATFLNTEIGKKLIQRGVYGAGQPHVAPSYVKEIPFPEYLMNHSTGIKEIILKSRKLKEQGQKLYTTAQKVLEKELGLNKLKFEKPVGFEANFSDLIQSNRMDAQHYRSKYDILFDEIKKRKWKYLRDICQYSRRGQQPIYVEKGEIDVVNSQHIGKHHLDYKKFQKTTLKLFESVPQAHIKINDLLIYTTGAYIGNTNVYLSAKPALASNHVNILRLKEHIDAAYLAVVLQSIIGQFQTEKHSRGSAQAELYPNDINRFIVPMLSEQKQKEIGDLSRESLQLNQQSYELLERAKQMVEDMIEQATGDAGKKLQVKAV